MALAVTILLLVGAFYFINQEGESPQELYALYNEPSKMNLINKGVNDKNISKIELAFNKEEVLKEIDLYINSGQTFKLKEIKEIQYRMN